MSTAKLTPPTRSVLFAVNYQTGAVTLPAPADSLEALHLAMGFLLRSAIAINGTPGTIPASPTTTASSPGGKGKTRKPLSAAHRRKLREAMQRRAAAARVATAKPKEKVMHA